MFLYCGARFVSFEQLISLIGSHYLCEKSIKFYFVLFYCLCVSVSGIVVMVDAKYCEKVCI